MNDLAHIDFMHETGDMIRGIKLDTAAMNRLGIRKIHCSEVEYSNLTATWRSCNIDIIIAYCAIDTILLALLSDCDTLKITPFAVAQ